MANRNNPAPACALSEFESVGVILSRMFARVEYVQEAGSMSKQLPIYEPTEAAEFIRSQTGEPVGVVRAWLAARARN